MHVSLVLHTWFGKRLYPWLSVSYILWMCTHTIRINHNCNNVTYTHLCHMINSPNHLLMWNLCNRKHITLPLLSKLAFRNKIIYNFEDVSLLLFLQGMCLVLDNKLSAGIDFGTTPTLVSLQSCLWYAFLLFGITPLHPSLQAAIASIVPFWWVAWLWRFWRFLWKKNIQLYHYMWLYITKYNFCAKIIPGNITGFVFNFSVYYISCLLSRPGYTIQRSKHKGEL